MQKTVYRFGCFELDPKSRSLLADGELLAMPPKSFECVAYLIEHRDRAVGRDELISAVWGNTEVSDHTLGQTLLRARQAMGDTGPDRTMIRTVSRFGYEWIAPVEKVAVQGADPARERGADGVPVDATVEVASASAQSDASVPTQSSASRATARSSRMARVVAAAAIVCVVATLVFLWRGPTLAPDSESVTVVPVAPASEPLFVVLPVQVDGDESPDHAWIRLGMMDYIANLIRQRAGQQVLPSDQVVSMERQQTGFDPVRASDTYARLLAASGASHVLRPRAEYADGRWFVSLEVTHGEAASTYEAGAPAPLPAAAQAVSQLLAHLGLAEFDPAAASLPHEELLQRIDAALLMGQLREASGLIASLAPDVRADPRVRVLAGNAAVREGRLGDAEADYRAVTDAQTSDLPDDVRAGAWMGLGAVALYRVDNAAGIDYYSRAIALLDGGSEVRLLGRALNGRGAAHVGLGEFDAGMADLGRGRIELTRARDQIGLANLEINVGMGETLSGRLEGAVASQDRAIRILTGFGIRDQLVIALHNKSYTQLALLDLTGALETSAEAMAQVAHLDNQGFNRRIAAAHTGVLITAGHLDDAESLIARFDGAPDDPAVSDTEFATLRLRLAAERGDYAAVVQQGPAAIARIDRSADIGGGSSLSEACWLIADAALRTDQPQLARDMLAHLVAAPTSQQDLERDVTRRLIEAELAIENDDPDTAAALYADALSIATTRGVPQTLLGVSYAWLRHLLAAGELDRAASVAGRLDRFVERDYHAARITEALYRALGRTGLAEDAARKVQALAGDRDPSQPL